MAALSLNRHTTPRPGGVVFTARGVPPAPRAAGAPARRFPSDRRRLLARPLVTTPHSALAVPTSALRASRRASRAPTLVVRASGGRDLAQYPVADRRAELSKMTVAQLKPLCKGSGLRLGGKKSELVDRLLEHEFGTTDDEADIDPREDIVGLAKEWRAERGVGGGVSFGEVDSVEAALRSAGIVDERAADAAYSALGFDDGGYSRSSEARGDQGPAANSSYAARLMGRDGGGFDDGGGSGWGDDDWDERDAAPDAPPEPTAEEIKAAAKARAREERLSLQKRSAMVAALRQLAFEREGFESDPRVHLEAVSRAIERAYRDMRWSKFAKMDPRSREACVDINVAAGTLTVLAQRVGRGGTVEWEVDDTEAFLEAHGKRHQLRKLARMFSEELAEAVSVSASESYRRRIGEMVEATVIAQGRQGEWLLKLDDGAFACLPEEESIPGKRYSQGDRACAIVVEVEEKTWAADKRAPVVVSTAIAGLLAEVFKAEIPEVANGDIVIKSVARVSGKLSKVAVARRGGAEEDGADPVSTCVGEQNVRLRNIRERLGGEICQVLAWSDDREELVAQALFPAQVERVEQRFDEEEFDERGEKRRLDKFVARVNRFDEAKAIGVGGMNVKLAAALCGCFILVERVEETRGFDDGIGSGWGDEGYDDAFATRDERREGIDISGAGNLDEFGWPDLDAAETPVASTARSRFDDIVDGGETLGVANDADGEEEEAYVDPREDDANWEEVGPGKVGLVTFGGNLGAGIAGGCSFMGDPEFAEAEALGDAAERQMGLLAEAEVGSNGDDFYDDVVEDDDVDHLFAEDDLMGEDWNR